MEDTSPPPHSLTAQLVRAIEDPTTTRDTLLELFFEYYQETESSEVQDYLANGMLGEPPAVITRNYQTAVGASVHVFDAGYTNLMDLFYNEEIPLEKDIRKKINEYMRFTTARIMMELGGGVRVL